MFRHLDECRASVVLGRGGETLPDDLHQHLDSHPQARLWRTAFTPASKISASRLTTDLYRQYLATVMDRLDETPEPSRRTTACLPRLSAVYLGEHVEGPLPEWCRPVSWDEYAGRRYERPARRLAALLAPENYRNKVGEGEQGWTVRADAVVGVGEGGRLRAHVDQGRDSRLPVR